MAATPTHRIWVLASAVALALGFSLAPPSAVRADSSANIPGIPLPSASFSGNIAASDVDLVYSVDVPRGQVLLVSLAGDPGTDLDLYLFDTSASTIYGTTGLVAKSTGPTSSEAITYPAPIGGTFFIDISNFAGTSGTFTLSVSTRSDTTPPLVSLTLKGGAPATNSASVAVTVIATDDLTGVADTAFSPDGLQWGGWQAYAPAIVWTFPPPDGTKTLWVRARDRAGNVSAPASASIILDTVAPTVVSQVPGPSGLIPTTGGVIRVTFSKPIEASGWLNYGLTLQEPSGTVVFGSLGYDAASRMGTFTPSTPLRAGDVYSATIGKITDPAGNALAATSRWSFTAVYSPSLTLVSSASVASAGAKVTLSGSTNVPNVSAYVLERSVGGGPWETAAALLPDVRGAYSAAIAVTANTAFRAHHLGTQFTGEAISPQVRVLVRRTVVIDGPAPALVRSVFVGPRVVVSASGARATAGLVTSFRLERWDPVRGTWQYQGTWTRLTTAAGRASISWSARTRGLFRWRCTANSNALFASGSSPWVRYLVQ